MTLDVSLAERAQLIQFLEEPDVAAIEPLCVNGVERRYISVNLSIRKDRLVIVWVACRHAHFARLENTHGQFTFIPYLARTEGLRRPR